MKESLIRSIHQLEQDIDNWSKIKAFLTVYLNEIAIPTFLRRAHNQYEHAL